MHPRPAALHAKYVGWNTKTNTLERVIDLDSATITQSQHNDFSMTLTADLKAGPYLVWLDGDGGKDVKFGNYQVAFSHYDSNEIN